jgi:uncharacterized protein (TIGR04222 family)
MPAATSAPRLTDPYGVAYLRGDAPEATRVTVFALLDRGLLVFARRKLQATHGAVEFACRPLERAVLSKCLKPRSLRELINAPAWAHSALAQYQETFECAGLLRPGKRERTDAYWYAVALLLGVAGMKIAYAFMIGKTNVIFLVLLAGGFWFSLAPPASRLTALGERVLDDQRTLFASLRHRPLQPGGQEPDAAWLAAVFGLAALSPAVFPMVRDVFPAVKASTGDKSDGGGGCGSGSSCSSSCSSGGGSCGGGCGGCGGGGGD